MTKTSRAEIVAAACELMRNNGYAGTSMKDIGDRVGLLKSSLYSHFPGKEALVPEVLALAGTEIAAAMTRSGDWRADYRALLERLVADMTERRRCVGLHLAYGADDSVPALRPAVQRFFQDLLQGIASVLEQGLSRDVALDLARETLTRIEGATLWLALDGDAGPMRKAQAALLAEAEALAGSGAADEPDSEAKALLTALLGDWRKASPAERLLAARTLAAEGDALTVRAALAGRIEAESCFR